MLGVHEPAEVATSVLHMTSLSVAVTHLAANDPINAWNITLVGCACVAVIALVTIGCEIVRFKVRQYIRKRELSETKPESPRLEG